MYNHAPKDYKCPICIAISGIENNDTLIVKNDIIYKDELVVAFISSFFIGNNPGHFIISPAKHFENIYDLPDEYGNRIQEISKRMAIVLKKAYKCSGITILQNNEPDGGQHAFHYHLHVFPRYKNDGLHKNMHEKKNTTPEERDEYVKKIKEHL